MDLMAAGGKAFTAVKKYRYVVLVVVIGIALMLIPGKETPQQTPPPANAEQKPDLAQELTGILEQMEGVGRVRVMLSLEAGEETIYEYDEDSATGESSASLRRDVVIITDEARAQTGLIRQVCPPIYRGAVVVCQGADRPSVRLCVVEAVAAVTGLSADRITVLKMK